MLRRAVCALVLVLSIAARAAALDVRVTTLVARDSIVTAAIDLRDLLPDRFLRMLEDGGVLHLRIQAELWESRPVWDRLVYPATVRVLRLTRTSAGRDLTVTDPTGQAITYTTVPDPMPITLEIGRTDRLVDSQQYYLRVIATLGTIADRDIDQFGDAVFGSATDGDGLGSLGRMVFRKMLEISDYLQSTTAETRGRKVAGRDILRK